MLRRHLMSFLAVSTVLGTGNLALGQTAQAASPAASPAAPPAAAPAEWWAAVQANLAASEYGVTPLASMPIDASVSPGDAAWQAANRAQNLRTRFTPAGFTSQPRDVKGGETSPWCWGLSLAEWGRDGVLQQVEAAPPQASGNRVSYDRGELVEWYINDERGLEQGFTLAHAPASASGAGPLRLQFAVTGNVTAKGSDSGDAIDFLTSDGTRAIRFAKLHVTDATGRVLPASFEVAGARMAILVDDCDATYPIAIDPLASNPAWSAEGNQVQANFGYWVSSAGDVNGDGFDDVIVGAPYFDNGELDEGRAFVFHGSAAGLSAIANWTAESNQPLAHFSLSVAAAGDVNGDGFGDVIVGAPNFDGGQQDEGRAYLYLGSASGLGAASSWTAESNQASAFFGISVATAGDVNGDGRDDVIIGARNYDNGQVDEGRVYAFYGTAAGLSHAPNWTAESNFPGSQFGVAVSTAGDVNGDGYDDVIVGAATYGNGQSSEGGAFVYTGSAAGLSAAAAWSAEGNQQMAYFGNSVATAGDVNGDGFDDVIVGAYFFDNGQTDEGRAYAYYGSAAGPSVAADWFVESNQAAANTGTAVACAGDVNGDGYDDVIVGSAGYNNPEQNEGLAFVYDGSSAGLSLAANWSAENNEAGSFLGISVASAGDVNGDGYDDVIVGAPYVNMPDGDEGVAFVYYGKPTWKNLGGSLAGTNGTPVLGGSGELIGGQPVTLTLTGAKASTAVTLVIGISQLGVPFKGGTLVPSPDILVPGLPTDAQGTFVLSATWPTGLPSGFSFYTQYWIPDAVGPSGFAASNGLSGTTP